MNPAWDFNESIYFGCKEAHYPLELLYSFEKLREAGHEPVLIDAHLNKLSIAETKHRLDRFKPDYLVIPTAPSYLFWRCPPLDLRVPRNWFGQVDQMAIKVAIGPHGTATPGPTMRTLGCHVVIRGEPDEVLAQLPSRPWAEIDGCCWLDKDGEHISSSVGMTNMRQVSALTFDNYEIEAHTHAHHVFSGNYHGAELECARGCAWLSTFCNGALFQNESREREVNEAIQEVDRLVARGVDYIYWIDEVFGVGKGVHHLLQEIVKRPISIGLNTQIHLWNEEMLDLLGQAHCIAMECNVESITGNGPDELDKDSHLTTDRIGDLLIYARKRIPWVQANLMSAEDDRHDIRAWQDRLKAEGVRISDPLTAFPYPGTLAYTQMFGVVDDYAWDRAHHFYASTLSDKAYKDHQAQTPASSEDLECTF